MSSIPQIRRAPFKDGVGYDPVKLLDSVRGSVALH